MGGRGSSSISRSQEPSQSRGRLTIGGKVFSLPSQIDAHYSNEYRKSREMLETNNAMNRSSSLNDAVYNVQWAYYPDWFSLYWFRNLYVSDAKVLWQAARHPDRIIMLVNE